MRNVFVIGATGGIGSRLCPMLVQSGHSVTGLHRQPEQAKTLEAAGVSPCCGDIIEMSEDDLIAATRQSDVIVFSAGAAGSGAERTRAIDGEGIDKVIAAAKMNKIPRIYLVSVFMDSRREQPRKDGYEHYISMKRQADNTLVASGLDWVILRPGRLQDDKGSGRVRANHAIPYGTVARDNVAGFLTALIDTPAIRREIIELTDGDTPIREAVHALER